jgi:hypothetical protein
MTAIDPDHTRPADTSGSVPPSDPAAIARERAHRNLVWGWALFGLFVVLFGGTVLVALAWIWLS